jgi:hypothetical protein
MSTPQTATSGPSIPLRPLPVLQPVQNGSSTNAVPGAPRQGYHSGSAAQENQTASTSTSTLVTANAGANTNTPVKNRLWTSNRVNLGLTVVVSAFAVAAYIAQLRSNWLSSMANKIAEMTYKEQVWKDCRDRTVRPLNPYESSLLDSFVGRAEFHGLRFYARYELRLLEPAAFHGRQ